jgi:hypothetical protein
MPARAARTGALRASAARGGTSAAGEREPEPVRALCEPARDAASARARRSQSARRMRGPSRRERAAILVAREIPRCPAVGRAQQAAARRVRPRRARRSSAARSPSSAAGSAGTGAPSAPSARAAPSAHEASAPLGTRGSASDRPVSAIAPLAAHARAGWASARPGRDVTRTPSSPSNARA